MTGLPHSYTTCQSPPLPTAGGESKFTNTHTHTHTSTHTCTSSYRNTSCSQTTSSLFLLISSEVLHTFLFFSASSPSLFCFAPDKPLFHIVAVGAEGQPLFTSTSQFISALYQPEGRDIWVETLHSSALQVRVRRGSKLSANKYV